MKVKLEVLVAVDDEGNWSSLGYGNAHGAQHDESDLFADTLNPGERRLILVAEVDAPTMDRVKAEVTPCEGQSHSK